MQHIRSFVARLRRNQRGLTTVEYAIVLCVIVVVAVGTWKTFGDRIYQSLLDSVEKIDAALTPST